MPNGEEERRKHPWITDPTQRGGWQLPSWLWRPEMEQRRPTYAPVEQGVSPPEFQPLGPLRTPMARARQVELERGTEFQERQQLLANIHFYEESLGYSPSERTPDEGQSPEELQQYLGTLEMDWQWRVGEPARATGAVGVRAGQAQYGAELPANVQTVIQEAQSIGMDTTKFERDYAMATTEQARGYTLWGFNQQVSKQLQASRIRESRVLAREFPEQLAEFERERAGTREVGRRGATPSEDLFYGWFPGQPGYEETRRGWEISQYEDYPRLYPWYQEAGGWETGKTFGEWREAEPLAQAYLRQRETPMPRPSKKQWQPIGQR